MKRIRGKCGRPVFWYPIRPCCTKCGTVGFVVRVDWTEVINFNKGVS